MRPLRGTSVVLSLLVLCACGPSAKLGGGKEGAAQALAQASSALTRPPSGSGVDLLNLGLSVEVKGARSGSARITYKTLASAAGGAVEMSVTYRDYSEDGRTYYNGTVAVKTSATAGPMLVGAEIEMVGKLKLTGEVEDFLDVSVVERVQVAEDAQGAQGAQTVMLQIAGSISTTDGTYEYGGEQLGFGLAATLPTSPR